MNDTYVDEYGQDKTNSIDYTLTFHFGPVPDIPDLKVEEEIEKEIEELEKPAFVPFYPTESKSNEI